jgi:integrase
VKGKNNEASVVPMNKTVCEVLNKTPQSKEYVFSELSIRKLRRLFEKTVKKAEIKDFRFHDLRHTFASYLWIGGENLPVIQKLMRHKDVGMTMRYSHLSRKHLEQAVEGIYKGLGPENAYEKKL